MIDLSEKDVRVVLALCDKVQLSGLAAMAEVLDLASRCQRALQGQKAVVPDASKPPKAE